VQRVEVQHHSPKQVAAYVHDALEVAQHEDVPDDLREAVFVESVRLLSSKTVQAVAHPQGISLPGIGH
jgi:hypothetical protein